MGKKSKSKKKGSTGSQGKTTPPGAGSATGSLLSKLVVTPTAMNGHKTHDAAGPSDREAFADQTNKAYLALPGIKSLQSTPLASSSAADIEAMENSADESPIPKSDDIPTSNKANSETVLTEAPDLSTTQDADSSVPSTLPEADVSLSSEKTSDSSTYDESSEQNTPRIEQNETAEITSKQPMHITNPTDPKDAADDITVADPAGDPSVIEKLRPESPADTMTSGGSFLSAEENLADEEITHINSSDEVSGDLSDLAIESSEQLTAPTDTGGAETPKAKSTTAAMSADMDTPTADLEKSDSVANSTAAEDSKAFDEGMDTPQDNSVDVKHESEPVASQETPAVKQSPAEGSTENGLKDSSKHEENMADSPVELADSPVELASGDKSGESLDDSISTESMETRELSVEETEVVNELDRVVEDAMDNTETDTLPSAAAETEATHEKLEVTETPAVEEDNPTPSDKQAVEEEAPPSEQTESPAAQSEAAEESEKPAELVKPADAVTPAADAVTAGGDNTAAGSKEADITPAATGDKTEVKSSENDTVAAADGESSKPQSKPDDGSIELTESQKQNSSSKSKASPSGPVEQGCCTIL